MGIEDIRINEAALNQFRSEIEDMPEAHSRYREEDFAGFSKPNMCQADGDPLRRHVYYYVRREVQFGQISECAHCHTIDPG